MKKRKFIILIAVAVLAAGGVYLNSRSALGQAADSLADDAQMAEVLRTTLHTSVESTGSIMPESEVSVSFGVAGTVAQVNVDVGEVVKAGDVLAALDTTDLERQLTQAEQSYALQQLIYRNTLEPEAGDVELAEAAYASAAAAYRAAQTDYANLTAKEAVQCSALASAQLALDRAQTAYDRLANDHQASRYLNGDWGPFQQVVDGLANAQAAYDDAVASCNISRLSLNDSALRSAQAQLQSAKTALENLTSPRTEKQIQAAAALEQARLSVEQARRNLEDATITAPFDGVVTEVNIVVGGAGGSAAITLADVSRLHVDVLVDETEIAGIAIGQQAEITLDALSGVTLTGTVDNIDLTGTVSNGVVNYKVRVNVDAADAVLRLDMTANASIIGEQHENVLAVPTTAIRTAPTRSANTALESTQVITSTQAMVSGNFVLVLIDGQTRPVPVTVGMTAGELTEVTGNLQAGDVVVIPSATSNTSSNQAQDFGGPPDGGMGGPPPGGAGGPPPF